MDTKTERTLFRVEEANSAAANAYWWLKDIDRETVDALGVADQIKDVLSLLQKVDNITIDIQITIKNKQQ